MRTKCRTGQHIAIMNHLLHGVHRITHTLPYRQAVFIIVRLQHVQIMPCLFPLIRYNLIRLGKRYRKGNQRRRHINIIKCTGRRILSTDGSYLQLLLCFQSTQQRRIRTAPLLRCRAAAKVLLETHPGMMAAAAGCHNLTQCIDHRLLGTLERRS